VYDPKKPVPIANLSSGDKPRVLNEANIPRPIEPLKFTKIVP
jgi:hypothetical protein